ncbi:hypothetical protein ABLB84_10070 [Xenorhabdus szentirmaii]|uniref:hypothetical protein n=1 Tax=Xenorhabdus szentirmaii TaxID=290112 RepID=UPI0032B7340B
MYKWDIPESYSNKNIGEYQYDIVDYLPFIRTTPIKLTKLPIIKFNASLSFINKYDYLPNNNSIPIISNRLKVFFEKNLPKIA